MTNTTLWERVDEPVLKWIASRPPMDVEVYELDLREPKPFVGVAGLTTLDVQQSLLRLQSHRLIDGLEAAAMRNSSWSGLRITAFGLMALGEWPDLDRVATAASLYRLLRALAEAAPEDEQHALKRSAGVVSRTADDVLRGTVTDIARTIGREAAGE